MTLTRSFASRTIVISAVGLTVASAVVAVVMLTSRPTSSALAAQSHTSSSGTSGMDHGSEDMGGMTDHGAADVPDTSPTTDSHGSDDMPGMAPDPNHGSDDMPGMAPDPNHGPSDVPSMAPDPSHSDVPGTGHGHGISEPAADRPLAPVLGTFGGGASAVMLTAGFLRRRDRDRANAKAAARAARKAQS